MNRRDGAASRRAVLSAVGAGVLGTAAAATRAATGVLVEQGDDCRAVRPLGGRETVADRYDYRAPFTDPSAVTFSSHGTVDLQRRDASVLFLYDGPRGRSLVMVHDALEDGTHGGSVSFEVAGLPPGREWVVEDDRYDGASNYDLWDHGRTASHIDWTWGNGRTDGAAVRGLGGDFDVRVTPAFNEAAALFGQHYDGRLTAWEFLSATDAGVERIPLRMDQPVRVRTGACDGDGGGGGSGGGDGGGDDGGGGRTPTDPGETPGDPDGPLTVPVDVVPDAVNPHRPGRLPVVVHSTGDWRATRVVPRTVRAGPAGARPVVAHPVDDGRGPPDLKLLFWLPSLGLDEAVAGGTGRLRLRARTRSGRRVRGADSFRVVPSRGRGEDEREERREEREERREEREERRERREERRERREEREEREERREEREEREERREEREEREERREERDEREERREEREERRKEREERREEREVEREDDEEDDEEEEEEKEEEDDDG